MHPIQLLIARCLLVAAFLVLGFAWGQILAPMVAEKAGSRFAWLRSVDAWRTAGFVALFLFFVIPGVALANCPVITDPCDVCKAIWPEWMCWLNCNL
jgi:hypothetical protein